MKLYVKVDVHMNNKASKLFPEIGRDWGVMGCNSDVI
jgi:predicted hydrocarbon binding protein